MNAKVLTGFEISGDLVGVMVDVDDDFTDVEGFETFDGDFEKGAAVDFDEGLGAVVGEWAEAGAKAGSEDHSSHLPIFSSSMWRS